MAIEWITHQQFGLACAAITFLTGVISERAEQPELFAKVPAAITKLLGKIILEKHTEPEYIYYGVPAPWLQAKALRLLQYFPPPTDETKSMLLSIISKILKATEKVVKDSQSLQKQRGTANRCNAMNCSLVELVSLVIQWELDTKTLTECTNFVNTFVNDKKDANMRYIGLLLLSRLSLVTAVPGFDFAALCKQFQTQVAVALHDPDISLRKKSLVLTYSICTAQNADEIVTELLRFLPAAGGSFKRDLALFIVAIAEKFAADVTWYVDTVFAVLTSAGEHLPEGIWHRLCVLIINTPSAQKHAVELVYLRVRALLNPNKGATTSTASSATILPESVVRVAAVLLGEFGYQIALNANASPVDQVMTLQSLLVNTTNATKGMILTSLLKAYNLFDGTVVREKIVKSIGLFVGNIDPELQQRAVEYTALIKNASDETLQATLEALPPMELEMGSIFQLIDGSSGASGGCTNDGGDLWIQKVHDRDLRDAAASSSLRQQQQQQQQGNVEATTTPVVSQPNDIQQLYALSSPLVAPALVGGYADPMAAVVATPVTPQQADTLDDLFSFGKNEASASPSSSTAARVDLSGPTPEAITRWFRVLCTLSPRGVLYEDSFVSVQAMYEYRNADVRLALTLSARAGSLQNISAKLASTSAALLVQSRDHATSCGEKETIKVEFAARSLAPFTDSPAMRLQFTPSSSTTQRSIVLSLPILSCGFCAPYKVDDAAKAEALWANTPSGDAGRPFSAEYRSPKLLDDKDVVRVLQHLKLFVVTLPNSGQTGGGEFLGVGAHATQSGANTQFTPLLVRARLVPSSGVLQVLIKNTSSLLQASMWEAMKWGLELGQQ
ncbi:alpha adaptin, putative [Bodo saltans]|uniref:Alpha adaptin, putative n=1 Tax=Bodo saltans TaxID=75058 RepID=A0A0S4IMH5_BODSA|nr:alpha adaptin, putative [Bodo saltans]|eukprot:CUF45940.1 alpha adaptin, putative [Bodo saltans]